MQTPDNQSEYWSRVGTTKSFSHPVNADRLRQFLAQDSRILDYGCGYGRVIGLLIELGYTNLFGVDPAPTMIAAATERYPTVRFELLNDPPSLPVPDASVDAVLLFAVLTCVPTDEGQLSIIREIRRVLRPNGILYISDLWLQADARNVERYKQYEAKYGRYGVFHLAEGVTLRHHDRHWIETLTANFDCLALDEIHVQTMNDNMADGFQWFGRR